MAAFLEQGAEKEMVVLFPSPGMGHLVSMVELAKLLVHQGFAVIVDPPYNTGATAAFITRASAANPLVSFHRLPPVALPPTASRHQEALAFALLRVTTPVLIAFLLTATPRALVVDMFCTYAFDAAGELRLPCYVFYTSGAAILAAFLYLHAATDKSFRELGSSLLLIPGLSPLPADHMPLPTLDRGDEGNAGFLHHGSRYPDAHGIIVNTFDALEPSALEAVVAGRCHVDGRAMPPIYAIGPLITSVGQEKASAECIAWLDSKPRGSVVFLCFGSLGLFSAIQLREIAAGLERSGQRFLWVVRDPPSDDAAMQFERPADPVLDALLPEGFLERGLVAVSWAPQAEVLRHAAVGGFVTHCGWNSVLEAVVAGVPMVCCPLYAEQRMNKVFLVEEMRLAAAMEEYKGEVVPAEEVARKVRRLIASEGGRDLRGDEAEGGGGAPRRRVVAGGAVEGRCKLEKMSGSDIGIWSPSAPGFHVLGLLYGRSN